MKYNFYTWILFLAAITLFFFSSCTNESGVDPLMPAQELCVVSTDGSDFRVIAEGGYSATFLPDSNKILFSGGKTELNGLYMVNIDGTGTIPVLYSSRIIKDFSFSPDNKKIVMPAQDGIYLMDLPTKKIRQILLSYGKSIRHTVFSGDNYRIVYQSNYDIEMTDTSGNTMQILKKENELIRNLSPSFIFEDNQIIYLQQNKRTENYLNSLALYSIVSLKDTVLFKSDRLPVFYDYLYISGGSRVLIGIGQTGPEDTIKIIDLTDNFKTTVLDAGYNFSFSPDQSKILYVKSGSIYMINPDGSGRKLVYSENDKYVSIGQPKLSFDGKYVLFGRSRQRQ
ncbi:MAG: hypothetical protein ACM34K_10105 [Bacillota bacterium]